MTRDEAINRIAEMIVSYKQEDEDDTSFNFDDEDIEALKMAISALSAIEDIKAEIEEKISHYDHFQGSNTAHGLEIALEIIDKHIEGDKE